ncbi:MAG: ribonuclease D [Magnetococcales bacterium]|nr:ribonuclease D [Magnetococcales bacterium]MBF0151432.1 ribonuclease D [Magnetococcales bacterium]MBF0174386.1 ribonuclease D [Magnetococcales bacterium]MBF0632784.1 ribonuclease D [Magnetococcales bacterium]
MASVPSSPTVFENDLDDRQRQRYLESRYLAVDTETLGLLTRRDRLCVVQMCNEEGVISVVQTKNYDAPRLKEVLESPRVEKIFHFARFDMAALYHWLGCRVQPVYCTKIASKLTRTYTSNHGLKHLVRELLGVEMDKEQQSSDWGADVLSEQQLAYTAGDVRYLVAIKERLDAILKRENRVELARDVMAALPMRVNLDLAGWENEDIFSHS